MIYKWLVLGFLFVTFFLEQSTRQVYYATLPQIKLDFAALGITDTQLGVVGTVFGSVFGLCLVLSGFAADFFSRKRVIVIGTLLFSVGVFVSGFAQGLGLMIVFYGIFNAIGQCCVAPPSYSLISQFHDNRTRSTAMSIFQSAVYIGIILSSALAGKLASLGAGGWRHAFWLFGALGLVWTLVLQFFMRDTPQVGAGDADKPTIREGFAALLTKPTAILIALAFGMYMYGSFGLRLWMTAYVARSFGDIGLAAAAFHAVFWMCLGAWIGCVVAARLIDRFGRGRPRIRLDVSSLGFILQALTIVWVASVHTLPSCCAALFVFGVTQGVYDASHYPAMFDCIQPRYRSVTTGLTGCLAFLMGSLAPVLMGWMNDHLTMRTGLLSLVAFYLLGALILVPAQVWFFKKDHILQE